MTDKRTPRLLVLDDDVRLRELLRRYLSEQGFHVDAIGDAQGLRRLMNRERYDLLILDWMLPEEDGLSLCRRLREEKNPIPIVMLTARGNDEDRILGLDCGADDYLAKPFNPRELLARIHAVLRRQPSARPPGSPGSVEDELKQTRFGPWDFNLLDRTLNREGQPVPMTSGEYALLRALVLHPREPLSREKLMDLARGKEHEVFDRSIDVQISRLRRLIEEDPGHPRYVQTVWGFGYVFVPDGA